MNEQTAPDRQTNLPALECGCSRWQSVFRTAPPVAQPARDRPPRDCAAAGEADKTNDARKNTID